MAASPSLNEANWNLANNDKPPENRYNKIKEWRNIFSLGEKSILCQIKVILAKQMSIVCWKMYILTQCAM